MTDQKCPICGRQLFNKAPCCGDKRTYVACRCGYKKAVKIKKCLN